jgi:nucleoside-diphosphate-sugar epimerase
MKGECTFMNILIAGANGTTGKQIIGELSKNPQMTVYGMIRKEEQAQTIKELGGYPILADLEGNVDKAVDNMEAIIFAAGSGPKTGPDKTTAVDKNGAIKLVDAAKKKGIKRFVMLSSVGSDNPEQAQAGMRHYLKQSMMPMNI